MEELGEAAIMKRLLNLRAVAAAATGSIVGSRSDGGNAITAADEEGIKCLPSSYMNGGGSSGGIGNGHGDDEAKDDGCRPAS